MAPAKFDQIPPDIGDLLWEQFGGECRWREVALSGPLQKKRQISRQAASALLSKLVNDGVLSVGKGKRPKTYDLTVEALFSKEYPLEGLEEHVIWEKDIEPVLAPFVNAAALRIWSYGVTEMVNNAIDHSEGHTVSVSLFRSAIDAVCQVVDDGEGIFRRITRLCKLADERQAILELSKGKLTTDPKRHSGEGVFFTSRAFDRFSIDSSGLSFSHYDCDTIDYLFERDAGKDGTNVTMHLQNNTDRVLSKVFDQFAAPDEFAFDRTVVPVRLAKLGVESLVSRSQAARLLARVDRFKFVMFDFTGVESIGQAFADEIFRVFANAHPEVQIHPTHANAEVQRMIRRAEAAREAGNL